VLSSRVVTVQVGRDKVTWSLHENLLSGTCDFFKAAFRGQFKENAGALELPEDNPAVFDLFVRWLYTKRASLAASSPLLPINGPGHVREYLQLYVFATKYLIEDLQNDVVDIVYNYFKPEGIPHPDLRDLQYLFENTGSHDCMRHLLAVHAAFELFSRDKGESLGLPEHWDQVLKASADVGYGILTAISEFGRKIKYVPATMLIGGRCSFHKHKDIKQCGD
jgi:hypothetical protein